MGPQVTVDSFGRLEGVLENPRIEIDSLPHFPPVLGTRLLLP